MSDFSLYRQSSTYDAPTYDTLTYDAVSLGLKKSLTGRPEASPILPSYVEDCLYNMLSSKELRLLFLYEFKLGHNAAVAASNIDLAFGEGTANQRTIRRWFEKFRSGDMNLENEPRGRPESVVNEEHLRATVEANPQTTVRALAIDLGVSIATVSQHLAAIGKVKKLDKWVPHELTDNQKLRHLGCVHR